MKIKILNESKVCYFEIQIISWKIVSPILYRYKNNTIIVIGAHVERKIKMSIKRQPCQRSMILHRSDINFWEKKGRGKKWTCLSDFPSCSKSYTISLTM